MTQVYVSIGSNQQAKLNIRKALGLLNEQFAPIAQSPVYETRPIGFDGENFLNLVFVDPFEGNRVDFDL